MRDCDMVCEKFRDRIPRAVFQKNIAPYDMRATLERIKRKKKVGSINI
jgi:hypothetical protein